MSTTQAKDVTVQKQGRKFQVLVDGKPHGKPTTKRAADAAAELLRKPTESTPEPQPEAKPQPQPETATEKAQRLLAGKDAKAAEAEIKKWQALLEEPKVNGNPTAKAQVEEMISAGDAYMSALEDGGKKPFGDKPQTRAQRAAAARAAKEAAAKAAAEAQPEDGERRTSTGRRAPRPSTISKDGTKVCQPKAPLTKCVAAPGQPQSVVKFPTISGEKRGDECRKCRDTRLAQAKESAGS